MKHIQFADGKYTVVINEETGLIDGVLRYGQPWRAVTGDNFIHAVVNAHQDLQAEVARLSKELLAHKDDRSYWADRCHEEVLTRRQAVEDAAEAGKRAEALERERHEWNVTKPIDAPPKCVGCGGPHPFDTSIPSPTWNRVIRGAGLPDYLCLPCIVKAFAQAGEGFTAELWGDGLSGVPIEVQIRSAAAVVAAGLVTENTRLRSALIEVTQVAMDAIAEVTKAKEFSA